MNSSETVNIDCCMLLTKKRVVVGQFVAEIWRTSGTHFLASGNWQLAET